jgi:hypothetical protein
MALRLETAQLSTADVPLLEGAHLLCGCLGERKIRKSSAGFAEAIRQPRSNLKGRGALYHNSAIIFRVERRHVSVLRLGRAGQERYLLGIGRNKKGAAPRMIEAPRLE